MWRKVAGDFSAAAAGYERHAHLQQQVIRTLAEQSKGLIAHGETVLDAGCGTGAFMQHRPDTHLIGVDLAYGMCQQAQPKISCVVQADIASLPLKASSVDHVISSLAIQWLPDPSQFFEEAHRVVREDGYLLLSSLGLQTLCELRSAYEDVGLLPPILPFHQPEILKDSLRRAGWKVMHGKQEIINTPHDSVVDLLRHLKRLGTRHKSQSSLRSQRQLQALADAYPASNGKIHASWEVLYIVARKG